MPKDEVSREMQKAQTIQPNAHFEFESSHKPDQKMLLKTRFNDAEYERWSNQLRNARNSKANAGSSK
jgi:hypothetical protein